MTLEQFHNGLRLLRSIDLHELQAVGLWGVDERNAPDRWAKFRDQPYDFFICCDDETADKIWAAMEKRMKK